MKSWAVVLTVVGGLMSVPAAAQTLTIGAANEPLSIDPQFTRAASNRQFVAHVFERLVEPGLTGKIEPALAESWQNLDPLTWIVRLRKNVKWHDGSPLTADDVLFSLDRVTKVPNSPAPFSSQVVAIKTAEKVDDHTIKFTTKAPTPLFVDDIGYVFIISKKAAEGKATSDFNTGVAAIGTGAYKFVKWTPGQQLEFVRNEDYWGPKPAYDKVVIRFIQNDSARIVAIRSGAVDMIEQVPPADIPSLKNVDNITLHSTPTYRVIYLALNQNADAPLLTDTSGKPLSTNPLKDSRVRQALSIMIDRQAIVDRLLSGAGVPANQFVNAQTFGFNPDIPPIKPDLAQAKKLLTDAGYPNGFGISIFTSNDRFPQDSELAQVIAQMFTRGGIKVNQVQAVPYAVYSRDAITNKYPAFTFTYGNSSGEALRGLVATLHTHKPGTDVGVLNRFGYSNAQFDAKITAASAEFDASKRDKMLQEAAAISTADAGYLPINFQSLYWATRKGIDFDARPDEQTLAMRASPKK